MCIRDSDRVVWVRSPYVCDGYAGPTGSLRRDPDGWATVGDIGALDGEIVTVGGRPDAVITAGATVLIADVEAALRSAAQAPFAVHGSEPVSYTHLDVYKRQILACRSSGTTSFPTAALMPISAKDTTLNLSLIHI